MAEQAPRLAVTRLRGGGDIGAPLLSYLRDRLEAAALEYAVAPTPILGGFDTAIYGFTLQGGGARDGACVARVFPSPADGPRARHEAAVQRAVAMLGFPAPEVLAFEPSPDVLGAPFIIMRRIPGRVMLDGMVGPRMGPLASLLGRTQARLHALDATAFRDAAGADADDARLAGGAGVFFDDCAAVVSRASLDGLRPALRWLEERRPSPSPSVICHGDYHPLNVLVERGEVTGVVDWAWVAIAPAEFDIGSTVALLGHGPVSLPRAVMPLVRLLRRWITFRYLRGYRSLRPYDARAVAYYEALRLLGFLVEAGEQMQAEAGRIDSTMDSPFHAPAVRAGAIARLRRITGLDVTLPA